MDDHINQFFDIIIMIVMLAFGCSLLATSYHLIDDKVDKEVRDDKTAIRNYTGVTLDSNPEATYEYTSQEVLLMLAIQDEYIPSTRTIRVGADFGSSTLLDSNYSTGNSIEEDMYGSNYRTGFGTRKIFLQRVYNDNSELYLNMEKHYYKVKTQGDVLTFPEYRQVNNLGASLDLTGRPRKWVLRMKTDDIAIGRGLRNSTIEGEDSTLNTGRITSYTKGYFWCFIDK